MAPALDPHRSILQRHVYTTCIYYMYILHVHTTCTYYMYILHVHTTCTYYMYALHCMANEAEQRNLWQSHDRALAIEAVLSHRAGSKHGS